MASINGQKQIILDENFDTLRLEGLTFITGDLFYATEASPIYAGTNSYGVSVRIGNYFSSHMAWYALIGYNHSVAQIIFLPTGQGLANYVSTLQFGAGLEHYISISGNFYFTTGLQVLGAANRYPNALLPGARESISSINFRIIPGFRYQVSRHFAVNLRSNGFILNHNFGENTLQPATSTSLRLGLSNLSFGMDYLF